MAETEAEAAETASGGARDSGLARLRGGRALRLATRDSWNATVIRAGVKMKCSARRIESGGMTASEDIAAVAGQLADLTRTVEEMGNQLNEMRNRSTRQQERSDTQQERIDLAARELAEVSDRLQAAANALRQSI